MTGYTTDERPHDRTPLAHGLRIRVLLIDDHYIIREGVKAIARAQSGIEIVADGSSLRELLPLIRAHRPDVLLLDLHFGTDSAFDAIREVRRQYDRPRVVVLTSHFGEEYLIAAVSAGAHGYVVKHGEPAEIFDAVRAVHSGRRYIAADVASGAVLGGVARFTTRELAVLDLLARGERNKTIGAQLGIAEQTVKSHVKNILSKLGAGSRTEAARKAMDSKLVKREE